MPGFFARLVSSGDRSVDEVIVGGLLSQLSFHGLAIYDVVAAHHDFSAVSYAGAASTILAATAAARAGRDRIAPPAAPPAGG
jgi:hypothetical protein